MTTSSVATGGAEGGLEIVEDSGNRFSRRSLMSMEGYRLEVVEEEVLRFWCG